MNPPKPIKKENLYEGVIEYLQRQIINGELKPGDRLPSQDVFARQLGVSRVTLREALKALNSLGLVTIKQGGGTFINPVNRDFLFKPMLPLILMNENVMEIIEARIYVELGTVQLCSQNRSQEDMKEMARTLEEMEKSLNQKDTALFTSSDLQFHLLIGKSSGNTILAKFLELIQDILYRQQELFNAVAKIRRQSFVDHQEILSHIQTQDLEGARQAMLHHLIKIRDFALAEQREEVEVPEE